jgi:hypothetical protein
MKLTVLLILFCDLVYACDVKYVIGLTGFNQSAWIHSLGMGYALIV